MAGHKSTRPCAASMHAPPHGQHQLVLRFQHGKPPDLLKVTGEAGFGRQKRQSRGTGHSSALQSLPPVRRRAKRTAAPRADGANFAATAKADRSRNITGQAGPKESELGVTSP